jgi:hypothetical protein
VTYHKATGVRVFNGPGTATRRNKTLSFGLLTKQADPALSLVGVDRGS